MKKLLCTVLAASLLCSMPVFAGSPRFARSEEEWASLEDDRLEYGEIDALVHEYNATVQNNSFELDKFKKDYGMTNSEIAEAYEELAAELMDSIDLGDGGSMDPTYALRASAAVINESTARNLLAQADSSLEDYETYRLNYEMAEKALAQSAKADMIAYYSDLLNEEQAALNAELSSTRLNVTSAQANVGISTQIEVMNATEALLNAQQKQSQATAATRTARKKLQVLCGWKYESEPEFGPLPAADFARADTIDPAADLEAALANNYTLRANERRLENVKSDTQKATLETTVASNRQMIAVSLNTAAATVRAARDSYNYAASNAALAARNLAVTEKGFAAGSSSAVELRSQQIAARLGQLAQQQAEYALLQAVMNYDYAVAGLAQAGMG